MATDTLRSPDVYAKMIGVIEGYNRAAAIVENVRIQHVSGREIPVQVAA